MIDIISLEKVLNSDQLSCFKKNIFDILNSEDINKNNHEMINPDIFQIPNKKDNIAIIQELKIEVCVKDDV